MPRKTTKKTQGGSAKQRSKNDASEETPPNPPPPPPAALIKLIQTNKSVLKYFQALQENLDYDVTKWKRRARKFQAESMEWKAKTEQLEAERFASASAAGKKRPADPCQKDEETEQPQRQRLRTQHQSENAKLKETDSRKCRESDSTIASKASSVVDDKLSSKQHDSKPAAENEDWLDLASMSSEEAEEEANETQNKACSGQKAVPALSILAMSSEDSEDEEEDEPSSKQTNQKRAPLHILALSSDDSEDNDDDDEYSTGWLEKEFSENQKQEPPGQKLQKRRNNQVLQSLKRANDLLSELGIILVTEKPIPQQVQNDQEEGREHSDSQAESTQAKVIIERREDSCVLTDLLQSIKALVRVYEDPKKEEDLVESYYPFMTKDLIPCFMVVNQESSGTRFCPHPAIEGMQSLSEAFHLMETNSSILDEFDEDDLSGHERLILGMKDRHIMVSNLVQSLEGEICQLWPVQDRASRLLTASIHFESNDDENPDTSMNEKKIAAPMKNFPRLAALMERCFLAQLVSRVYLARQDPRGFFQFFWRYLMATTPAIAIDTTPFKLPPVQSLCILESILCGGILNADDVLTSHFSRLNKGDWKWISQTVGLLVEATGMIQLCRSKSEDERIADTSRVELAAKSRMEANHPFWKEYSRMEKDNIDLKAIVEELQSMVKDLGQAKDNEDISPTLQPVLLQALLVTLGDVKFIHTMFASSLQNVGDENAKNISSQILACVKAKKWLEIRMIDKLRQVVLSPSALVVVGGGTMRLWYYSKELLKVFHQIWTDKKADHSKGMELAILALTSCLEMADGESALNVLEACLTGLDGDVSNKMAKSNSALLPSTLNAMETVAQAIVVRVINLERRPDRLASFLAQAAHHNLLVMRAVMLNETGNNKEDTRGVAWNHRFCHAYDGGNGRPAEIESRLAQRLGCTQEELSQKLVRSHWRPNDLQVFDSEAPDTLEETRISPSEKACALSHVASWKGAMRSLEGLVETSSGGSSVAEPSSSRMHASRSIFRNPSDWRQRFQISGYARGPPLFCSSTEAGSMPPTPVCIILEDDAILVDRFADRLQQVLEELPRDFHVCSIGYSRPKTAPLIPFGTEISIPTCIWYLTGYIISLKGCQYLLNQLPVRGPVDSWIGLKMFQNWDNMYGHDMGVGMSSSSNKEDKPSISKKELRTLLKFRAFCATVPLCSQKVGVVGVGGGIGGSTVRNWRQRDTDIVYSGNSI